jgi:gliding motility-associated lipoprotein GldH
VLRIIKFFLVLFLALLFFLKKKDSNIKFFRKNIFYDFDLNSSEDDLYDLFIKINYRSFYKYSNLNLDICLLQDLTTIIFKSFDIILFDKDGGPFGKKKFLENDYELVLKIFEKIELKKILKYKLKIENKMREDLEGVSFEVFLKKS